MIQIRLPRSRRGKTPIDVGIVEQKPGQKRIRLSVGEDFTGTGKRNSDLDFAEVDNLVRLLAYHLAVAKGDIKVNDDKLPF